MHSLRPHVTALCFILLCALLANRAVPQSVASAKLAFADRNSRYPNKDEHGFIYYLDDSPYVGDERDDLLTALRLMIFSTSLQRVAERTLPVPLDGTTLHRIDLRELGWNYDDWKTVLSRNPYCEGGFGLTVRMDWLLLQLADMTESDAYLRLLYGSDEKGNIVTTRDQVLAKLGVSNQREHVFGLIEGKSGVAKQGTRWIENRPMLRGSAWGTRDTDKLTVENDALEHPDGTQLHQAEEWIFVSPVVSASGLRGARQLYLLANGQGQIVNEAPVRIVEDDTEFRRQRAIINPGGCIQCHRDGMNLFTENAFRQQMQQGVVPFTSDPTVAEDLQSFHLGDPLKELSRNSEDYQTMVALVTGVKSGEAADAFKRAINRYDAPLDLTRAAEEFTPYGWVAADVTAALEGAANSGQIGARLAGLTRGRPVPRAAWEQQFLKTLQFVNQHVTRQEQVGP